MYRCAARTEKLLRAFKKFAYPNGTNTEGDDIHLRNSRKNEARYVAAERLWDTPQSSLKTHQALLSRVNAEKLSDLRVLDGDVESLGAYAPFFYHSVDATPYCLNQANIRAQPSFADSAW